MMIIAMPAPPKNLSASKLQIVEFGHFLSLDAEVVERLFLRGMAIRWHCQLTGVYIATGLQKAPLGLDVH